MEAPKDRISNEEIIAQLLKNGDDGVSNPGGLQPPTHKVVQPTLNPSRAAPLLATNFVSHYIK